MLPFKITSKWITIEVYRRGIVFSVATILLTTGATLCNEEVIVALISIINKNVFHEDCDNYTLFVGVFLILIALFLYYLLIINWRKEIYSRTFQKMRKAVDEFGTSWRARTRFATANTLRPLHTSAYNAYLEAFHFLGDNQTLLDIETYEVCWDLLDRIGEEIIHLDTYIKKLNALDDMIALDVIINTNYDPEQANKDTKPYVDRILKEYRSLVELIKEKEKYRIK